MKTFQERGPYELTAGNGGRSALLLVCTLALSLPAYAQTAEENVRETNRALVKPARGARMPDLGEVTALVVKRVNALRDSERSPSLVIERKLMAAAADLAEFMARTDRYGHQADGRRPAERAAKRGYDYCIVSENISYQFNSAGFTTEELAARLVNGWRDSPGHRRNLLDPDVTETGVAVARSEQTGHFYAVQVFGRPKGLSVGFRIANESDAVVEYETGGRSYTLPPRFARSHEQCRAADLVLSWPDRSERTRLAPANGDRYTIVRDGTGFALRRQ
jgi:uncharacterized protein YkwD